MSYRLCGTDTSLHTIIVHDHDETPTDKKRLSPSPPHLLQGGFPVLYDPESSEWR